MSWTLAFWQGQHAHACDRFPITIAIPIRDSSVRSPAKLSVYKKVAKGSRITLLGLIVSNGELTVILDDGFGPFSLRQGLEQDGKVLIAAGAEYLYISVEGSLLRLDLACLRRDETSITLNGAAAPGIDIQPALPRDAQPLTQSEKHRALARLAARAMWKPDEGLWLNQID